MNAHADALWALSAWRPADRRQLALRDHFIGHLRAEPLGLDRSCHPAHLTASAIVADPTADRVLLVLHAKAGLWLATGGHWETGDATIAAAALREATEESGVGGLRLDEQPLRLDRHPGHCRAGAVHLDVTYVAWAPPSAVAVSSSESLAASWFASDALPEPTDEALRRLVRAVAVRRRSRPVEATATP